MKFREDPRYKQTRRETISMVVLLILNIGWWFGTAYGLGSGDPGEYVYILGFPAWFFLSCIVSVPLFSALVWVVVSLIFVDMPLEIDDEER
jgi:uncharacterized membrane protein YhdT